MTIKSLAAVLALLAGVSTACAQAPIVIKFSHVVAPDTPKGQAAERFKLLAEQFTRGRVKVEVYPNSQLYKDKEELEALQLGAVQMLAPSLAKFGPLGVKEFEAFDLPYIFPSKAALYAVTEGEIGRALLGKLQSKGITGLAYWDNGFKVMSANRPLHVPADFRGLRMRIQASTVLDAQMRALGARPQVTAFSEAYQALRDGRGRRHRESALEHVHPAHARGAKAPDGVAPWLSGLCGDRQPQILGRPAGRRARGAGAGDARCDRLRKDDRPARQRPRRWRRSARAARPRFTT